MFFDFKITTWERITVPEEHEAAILEKIKSGEITTGNDLYAAMDEIDTDELVCRDVLHETEDSMTPEENGGCATIEILDDKRDKIWSNEKNNNATPDVKTTIPINEAELIAINTSIAQYMGYDIIPYQNNELRPIYNENKYAKTYGEKFRLWGGLNLDFTGRFTEHVQYPFNTDFRYLIPVIQRIEESGYVVAVNGINYQIHRIFEQHNPIIDWVCGDLSKKTEMVCRIIVEFIKWHNNQKENASN
jgi:hypothetical protein